MTTNHKVDNEYLSKTGIARKLGVSRMTIYNWLANPDSIPLGAYRKMQAIGINIETVQTPYKARDCNYCKGSGVVFENLTQPQNPGMTEIDNAIYKFKEYLQGNGSFDELDFKEEMEGIYSKNEQD